MIKKYLILSAALLAFSPLSSNAQSDNQPEKEITDGPVIEVNVAPNETLKLDVKETVAAPAPVAQTPQNPVMPASLKEQERAVTQNIVEQEIKDEIVFQEEEERSKVTEIDMNSTAVEATVTKGEYIEIAVLEETPYEWYYEKNTKTLRFVGANKDDNKLLVTYEVIADKGFERVYFDYMDKSTSNIQVLESRILDLTVE